MSHDWPLYTGSNEPHSAVFPKPPAWRTFGNSDAGAQTDNAGPPAESEYWNRARSYQTPPSILDAVNAALALRRPLLVTGKPGTGKSSLIYRIAYELQLGEVLVWPVNSRSTLKEGLYEYDAIARLQERAWAGQPSAVPAGPASINPADRLDDFIVLRALGTALLPSDRPRALLIDELDKADPDLPNDLLNVFEEGWYDITELQRSRQESAQVRITTQSSETINERAVIEHGRVHCKAFPVVVMTSNDERDFSPAFLRRCIRVDLPAPDTRQLTAIVSAHFGADVAAQAEARIASFASAQDGLTSTDQLLNAVYVVTQLNGDKSAATYDALEALAAKLTKALT